VPLVRYLHSKRIVIKLVILVSNILVLIAILLHINNADLCAFNEGGNSTEDIVVKV